jgi:hypothetical protein
MQKKIVVMTPVKNDDWILNAFLKAATIFADHIILLDQQSNDRTSEIIKQYEKVDLFENKCLEYNEKDRQELLIKRARNYGRNNILIALDVDEFFSPSFYLESNLDWLRSLNPGTSISLNWANIHWNRKMFWKKKMPPIIYIDDGQDNLDFNTFHRTRVPVKKGHKILSINTYDVIHLQYLDVERVKAKHRWYQLYELRQTKKANFVHIYRKYHHMKTIAKKDLRLIPESWNLFLGSLGIDLTNYLSNESKKWCRSDEINLMANEISQEFRNKIDLEFNFESDISLPKSNVWTDKLIYRYLNASQKYYKHSSVLELIYYVPIRIIDLIVGKVWK